MWIWNGAHPPP